MNAVLLFGVAVFWLPVSAGWLALPACSVNAHSEPEVRLARPFTAVF
jgi:hypothetical protein